MAARRALPAAAHGALARCREHFAAHADARLTGDELAALLGVSRQYAAKIVQRLHYEGLLEHVTVYRLRTRPQAPEAAR